MQSIELAASSPNGLAFLVSTYDCCTYESTQLLLDMWEEMQNAWVGNHNQPCVKTIDCIINSGWGNPDVTHSFLKDWSGAEASQLLKLAHVAQSYKARLLPSLHTP